MKALAVLLLLAGATLAQLPPLPPGVRTVASPPLPPGIANIPPVAKLNFNPDDCPPVPGGGTWYKSEAMEFLTNPVPYSWGEVRLTNGVNFLEFKFVMETGKIYEIQYTVCLPPTNYPWPPDTNKPWPVLNWLAYTRSTNTWGSNFVITTHHPIYQCDNRFFRVRSD